MKLRIMTYNVGHGMYNKDYLKGDNVTKKEVIDNVKGSLKLIKDNKADIILLQETGKIRIGEDLIDYNQKLCINGYNNEYLCNRYVPFFINVGNTVMIKNKYQYIYNKIINKKRLHGFKQNLFCQNKGCIKLTINNLVIYNIHLCPYQKNRLVRDEQLINILKDAHNEYIMNKEIIIGGDFNMLLKEGITYLDKIFKLYLPKNNTCRTLHKPFKDEETFTLDGFIVSKGIKVNNIKSLYNFDYSDHSPVIMEINL